MTLSEFETTVAQGEQAVIIDVWAPWCGPCKAIKPHFDSLADEFGERARVLAINADESPSVVEKLKVYTIPTVLVYRGGQEIARRRGAQSPGDLRSLFEAAVEGKEIPGMSNKARIVRIIAAVGATVLAERMDPSWPMQILALGLFASAIHDRCPIIQALKRPFSRTTPAGTA